MLHDQDLLSVQEVRSKVDLAYAAWTIYKNFSQEQVDAVVEAMAAAGRAAAQELAELAVRETGMGNVPDKIAKNLLNSDLLPRKIRSMKTVGILRELPEEKVIEIGVPVGVVAAILPTTNPTSTAIYKTIISLKGGNAVVISPHPRAKECTCRTAELLYAAACQAGAPENIIQCITNPTLEATNALMRHPKTGVILSTGGSGIVRAAYSSGKPAFGVGPGNVPVFIDVHADVPDAVAKAVEGKAFDYGTVCSSEQAIVAERSLRDTILAELKKNGAYLLSAEERGKLERVLFKPGTAQISAECVGQSSQKIAEIAGISVPAGARILVAEIEGVGRQHLFSAEKLSPVLAVYFPDTYAGCLEACEKIIHFGGLGHTCVIFSNDEARVREFGLKMPAFRVLVNTPSPHGSTGITTNVLPSMTLGCGAMAGNITSDNVGPLHLINIKRIAWAVRTAAEAFTVPLPGAATAAKPKSAVSAAVEKFLAQRGLSTAPAAKPQAAPLRSLVESVVDQFLASKPAAPTSAPVCPVAPEPAPQALEPPAPPVVIVDFVCEADVRAAIAQNKKIYIGPKSIVTPSAREAAGPNEVLVLARR